MSEQRVAGGKQGFIIATASSLTIMGSVMVSTVLPKIGQEFGPITPNADVLIPLIITLPALMIAIFSPLAGWLSDHIGRKNILIMGIVLYVLTGVLPIFVNSINSILVSRALFGLGEAAIMTCCAALIADYWSEKERLKYVNWQVIATGVVGTVVFVLGGALGESSWRTPFYLYCLPILFIPFVMKVLWEPEHLHHEDTSGGRDQTNRTTVSVNYFMMFFAMVMALTITIELPAKLFSIGVTSTTVIGIAAGLNVFANLLGALMWSFVRNLVGIMWTNTIMLLLMAIGIFTLVDTSSYEQAIFSSVIHGLGLGMIVPNIMFPTMNALSKKSRARGIGGLISCLYLGQFTSPLVVALLSSGQPIHSQGLTILAWAGLLIAALWGLRSLTLTLSEDSDYFIVNRA